MKNIHEIAAANLAKFTAQKYTFLSNNVILSQSVKNLLERARKEGSNYRGDGPNEYWWDIAKALKEQQGPLTGEDGYVYHTDLTNLCVVGRDVEVREHFSTGELLLAKRSMIPAWLNPLPVYLRFGIQGPSDYDHLLEATIAALRGDLDMIENIFGCYELMREAAQ